MLAEFHNVVIADGEVIEGLGCSVGCSISGLKFRNRVKEAIWYCLALVGLDTNLKFVDLACFASPGSSYLLVSSVWVLSADCYLCQKLLLL